MSTQQQAWKTTKAVAEIVFLAVVSIGTVSLWLTIVLLMTYASKNGSFRENVKEYCPLAAYGREAWMERNK